MSEVSPRYRIQRRLGQGGMAEVFEAALAGELGFERKVAIKRMLPDAAADPAVAQRFLDEARIASRLHHANIVSVVDLGVLDGLPFQVLELVDGLDAEQLLRRAGGRVPLEVALIIAGEIAHGLDHAHHATDAEGIPLGIVHRDVKPSNVMLSWAGDVKLTDFGIAVARDRAAKTEAGGTAGTRGFMAPEQRTRGEVDGRTDVFALGLALHALVTGENPLRDLEVEIALVDGTPVPLDPSLPPDVRAVIARAVAPRRLDRITAAQLADELGGLLASRQIRDRRSYLRASLAELAPRTAKRGALDQLLGIEVVPTDSGGASGVARYATVAAPAPGDLRPTAVAAPRQEPDALPVTRHMRPARRWVLALGFATAPVVVAVGYLAWPRGGHEKASAAPLDATVPPTVASAAPPPAREPVSPPLPAVETDSAVETGSASTPGSTSAPASTVAAPTVGRPKSSPGPSASRPHGARATTPQPASASPHTAAKPDAETGYVQIAGENVMGMQVVIDGKPEGYAPHKLAVPLGRHRIELVSKDGTRTAPAEIEVTSFHTFGSPARPAF